MSLTRWAVIEMYVLLSDVVMFVFFLMASKSVFVMLNTMTVPFTDWVNPPTRVYLE